MSYNNIYLVCDGIIPLVFTTWPGHPLSAMIPLAEECRTPDLGVKKVVVFGPQRTWGARLEETVAFLGGPPRAGGALSEDTAPPARALESCFGSEKSRTCNPLQPDSGWSECKYDFLHPQGSRQGVREGGGGCF